MSLKYLIEIIEMKNKMLVSALLMATIGAVDIAYAEDSEKETPKEEQQEKQVELDLPDAVVEHIAYLQELQERYPDTSKLDIDALLEQEGEKAALIYCKAIGFDGPCSIDEATGQTEFKPLSETQVYSRSSQAKWWSWLNASNFLAVGVIPESPQCSTVPYAPRPMVTIYMDDEDRRNANSRGGWIGATVSGGNTAWRYCRVESYFGSDFKPLAYGGKDDGYAVLKLGALCPTGSRTISRYQDNEDRRNANAYYGNVYPNVNVGGRNWLTHYCHFDGGVYNSPVNMSEFPSIGFPYGVFASERMHGSYAMQYGYVYQDDEDFYNLNWWSPSPTNTAVMGGDRNTWWKLVKVK
jgi:hypothetical protein